MRRTRKSRKAFVGCYEDEELEVGNNRPRAGLREVATRRKNRLFFDGDTGQMTSEILTRLIAKSKRPQMKHFPCIRDILQHNGAFPVERRDGHLPDNWEAAQRSTKAAHAWSLNCQNLCRPPHWVTGQQRHRKV